MQEVTSSSFALGWLDYYLFINHFIQDLFIYIYFLVVIVEEAAEVLEAHIVSSLTEGCEQVILIGKFIFYKIVFM